MDRRTPNLKIWLGEGACTTCTCAHAACTTDQECPTGAQCRANGGSRACFQRGQVVKSLLQAECETWLAKQKGCAVKQTTGVREVYDPRGCSQVRLHEAVRKAPCHGSYFDRTMICGKKGCPDLPACSTDCMVFSSAKVIRAYLDRCQDELRSAGYNLEVRVTGSQTWSAGCGRTTHTIFECRPTAGVRTKSSNTVGGENLIPRSACEPGLKDSCGGKERYCDPGTRSCQACPAGRENCDGVGQCECASGCQSCDSQDQPSGGDRQTSTNHGHPDDSDQDGILEPRALCAGDKRPNCPDKCSFTNIWRLVTGDSYVYPAGHRFAGCARNQIPDAHDQDSDGVANEQDDCPDTMLAEPVNARGCSLVPHEPGTRQTQIFGMLLRGIGGLVRLAGRGIGALFGLGGNGGGFGNGGLGNGGFGNGGFGNGGFGNGGFGNGGFGNGGFGNGGFGNNGGWNGGGGFPNGGGGGFPNGGGGFGNGGGWNGGAFSGGTGNGLGILGNNTLGGWTNQGMGLLGNNGGWNNGGNLGGLLGLLGIGAQNPGNPGWGGNGWSGSWGGQQNQPLGPP